MSVRKKKLAKGGTSILLGQRDKKPNGDSIPSQCYHILLYRFEEKHHL